MPTVSFRTLATGAQAVGGARAVRDHQVILGQRVVVDAVDDGGVGAVGGRRDQHALGTGGQMRGGLVLGGEDAGAFQRDVDAERLPRQLGGIALGRDLDLAATEVDRVAVDGHGAGEAAVHGIEAQQVRIGLDRAEVVDADNLDVLAAGLGDGAQHIAADTPKPVDRDADCHARLSSNSCCRPRGRAPTRVLRRNARFSRARTEKMELW